MLSITMLLVLVPVVSAQEPATTEVETVETTEVTVTETTTPSFGGDLWTRSKLTGDWGGVRNDLAAKGITLDIDYTQIFQGNAHGGRSTKNALRASGSGDIELTLDTQKMGLWPGGSFLFHAEPKWGDGINPKVGSLVPVNFDAVIPGSGEGAMFTLSEWIFTQGIIPDKLAVIAGKLFGARAFDTNVFANDERTQFMNTALRNNPIIPAFLPYTNLGIGVIAMPTDWLTITTAVADSEGRAKTTGFETAFHGAMNTTIIHEWAFKVKPFGLPGNQRIGFLWSSMDFSRLDPNEPFNMSADLAIKLLGLDLANKVVGKLAKFRDAGDNVAIYYNFDQYLYTEDEDPSQGIGLFGRFGWARQDVNPIAHFYSIGVGGKGVLPERDNDTCGLGYYFADLSNQMPPQYHSEQGIECYYNIEVTPWLHISPDLQVIVNPGGTDFNDVSFVYGVRMQVNL